MDGIVITGMGIVSALGTDVVEFHERLLADEVAIHPAPWARPERNQPVWWCSVKDFDPLGWIDPKIVEGTDIFAQYALAATAQALCQTGLLGMADGRFAHIANTDEPDPVADFEIVVREPKRMNYDAVQVNAFGFGGQNASLILTRN